MGAVYQFQPLASDPDGDALRFTAENLPPWANIDAASGQISGTPSAADVGAYESISITVADAALQARAGPFIITVLEPATGMASLQWEIPATKVDGSPLDDLAGYRIRYGRAADNLDSSVFVGDPATTTYQFSALDTGIWYFAVIAVNELGLEGPASIAAMKSI